MSAADLVKILNMDIKDIALPPTLLMDVKDVPPALMEAFRQARKNTALKKVPTTDDLIYEWNGSVDTLVVNSVATEPHAVSVPNLPAANDKLHRIKPISATMTTMAIGYAANDRAVSPDKERRADLKDFKNSDIGKKAMKDAGLSYKPNKPFEPK